MAIYFSRQCCSFRNLLNKILRFRVAAQSFKKKKCFKCVFKRFLEIKLFREHIIERKMRQPQDIVHLTS